MTVTSVTDALLCRSSSCGRCSTSPFETVPSLGDGERASVDWLFFGLSTLPQARPISTIWFALVILSPSPAIKNRGSFRLAQTSTPGIPRSGAFETGRLGRRPHAILRQTGVRLCSLNLSCNFLTSMSASFPTKRAMLALSGPPRLSQVRQISNMGVGIRSSFSKRAVSLSEGGES